MADETTPTAAIFAGGAVGGIALDVLGLYFAGFPDGHYVSWYLGRLVIALLFMALTGFLACVYANGQLKTAFVIGVAAPSILLNIAASVQKPKEGIPVIPSISAPGVKSGTSLDAPVDRWSPLGLSMAEAQQPAASGTTGQLKIAIGSSGLGTTVMKDGELLVYDASGKLIGKTIPPSAEFLLGLQTGKYSVKYMTPKYESPLTAVTVHEHGVNQIVLPLKAVKSSDKSLSSWSDFFNGANSRFEKVFAVK